jgi:hypothetical protein
MYMYIVSVVVVLRNSTATNAGHIDCVKKKKAGLRDFTRARAHTHHNGVEGVGAEAQALV